MKQEISVKEQKNPYFFNRLAYGLFLILSAYLLAKGDVEWAIANFGIALVFDPFDVDVKFNDRPSYQKVWLFVHVAISMAGFVYLIIR